MLETTAVSSFEEKIKILENFQPRQKTWIVSDLQSKLHLQSRFLEGSDFLEEDAVLRISELWRRLADKSLSQFSIISVDLARSLLHERLSGHREEWARRPGTSEAALYYMNQLMPVLTHPEGRSVVEEWFEKNPLSRSHWGAWFFLCEDLWRFFKNDRILTSQWISGALLNTFSNDLNWSRPLIIDVGIELNSLEIELLRELSKSVSIQVLEPTPRWSGSYAASLHAYHVLAERPIPHEEKGVPEVIDSANYLKFSTMTAEVKNSVAQVREWLDQGISLQKIAIVAPDIESYWATLQMHLKCEGIPSEKSLVSRIQSLPDVSRWLSELRLQSGKLSFEDLENRLYGHGSAQPMKYDEFVRVFQIVYGEEDLRRSEKILKLYQKEFRPDDSVNVEDFFSWSLKYWPGKEVEILETLAGRIFQECPYDIQLPFKQWLYYLESVVSKVEIESEVGQDYGLQCLSLMSAEYTDVSHVIVLGLTESALRSSSRFGLSQIEVLQMSEQTGFCMTPGDHDKLEFECRWFLGRQFTKSILSFPATDFNGSVQAPSLLWLNGRLQKRSSEEAEHLDSAGKTRWDELQNSDVVGREWIHSGQRISDEIEFEKNPEKRSPFAMQFVQSLSATSLERYLECPFRFAAEKIFRLSDLPSLDLDVDYQTRGILMHGLFEKLLQKESLQWSYTDEELSEVINTCRKDKDIKLADERLWPPLQKKYMVLAKLFLQFERDWRQEFPETKTIGQEVRVEGVIDRETGELRPYSAVNAQNGVLFRGSIDRLDVDSSKNAAVIDYKSSKGSLKQYKSWVENDQLQLSLYAQAVESGLTEFGPLEVIASLYFVGKTMDRETGFKVTESEGSLYKTEGRKANKIGEPEKLQLFAETQEKVSRVVKDIDSGLFSPQPKDLKLCKDCRWSRLCRAPHLN